MTFNERNATTVSRILHGRQHINVCALNFRLKLLQRADEWQIILYHLQLEITNTTE